MTIVSTALPTILGDLGGGSHLSWVVTAYLLAATTSTPLWGKLGDLYGRRVFLQAAIVIFLAGSVLAGISDSVLELILFRAVQGLGGGGGLIVTAQALVGNVVPARQRGRYQGLFGAVFGVTSVAGPLLGGFFVEQLSWWWVDRHPEDTVDGLADRLRTSSTEPRPTLDQLVRRGAYASRRSTSRNVSC